jgi:branched-chain amino acid transport system ATP-binding protein
MESIMLKVEHIRYAYSGIVAVRDVSLEVKENEIVALIGSNGAGKSTSVKMIAGIHKPLSGKISFKEESIGGKPSYEVVERGVTLVPEGRLVFPQMTVYENLLLGAHPKRSRPHLKNNFERVFTIFSRLADRRNQNAGSLSGGEQQMLAVARGLMASPKLMIFDEPSLGLSPILVQNLFELIKRLNAEGISILLVEQNAHLSLHFSNRGYVLEKGRVVLSGLSKELLNNSFVKKAFLGL